MGSEMCIRDSEVSLNTGRNVLENIGDEYEPLPVTVSREGTWSISPDELAKEVDAAFVAMHGPYGEDGGVQRDLEEIGVRYTGADSAASALGMNKFLSLQVMGNAGLNFPATILLHWSDWRRNPAASENNVSHRVGFPLVVKPNRSGSSVDTIIVSVPDELSRALPELFSRHRDLIVQPYVRGREITCGVLDNGIGDSAYALPPILIRPRNSAFFDYREKYDDEGAEEIVPAPISDAWRAAVERAAIRAHNALGLRHLSRTDMIMGEDGRLYVLETNTIPGLTKQSLLPKAAQAAGISFTELIGRIVKAALR